MESNVADHTEAVIRSIYETISAPETWSKAVRLIGDWLEADLGMMTSPSLPGSQAVGLFAYGFDLTSILAHYPKHAGKAEFTLRAIATGQTPGAFLLDDLMPVAERAQNEFWQEMVAPLDITSGIFSMVRTPEEGSGRAVILNYYRRNPRPHFSNSDVRRFSDLLPHLRRALAILLDAPPRRTTSADAIDAYNILATPCFVLSRDGEILHMNEAGRIEAVANNGFAVRADRLALYDLKAQRELDAHIERIGDSAWSTRWHMGSEFLARRPCGQSAILVATPLARDNPIVRLSSSASCLVTILDERNVSSNKTGGRLRRLYGLTDAEIDIAIALSSGQSPNEIAELRHTSVATVRAQIKAVFGKTGARRTPALLALINRLKA